MARWPGSSCRATRCRASSTGRSTTKGEAEDNGEVVSRREMAEVPAGMFTDVMLTKDTITIEPEVLEYRLYAKGVGPVLVFGVSGGSGREELLKKDTAPPTAGTGPLGQPNP